MGWQNLRVLPALLRGYGFVVASGFTFVEPIADERNAYVVAVPNLEPIHDGCDQPDRKQDGKQREGRPSKKRDHGDRFERDPQSEESEVDAERLNRLSAHGSRTLGIEQRQSGERPEDVAERK